MTASPGKRVAVVGGGPSGMTAALLLARAGHRVVIFEHRGPLRIKSGRAEVYVATNLNGQAPYFTASLESAIQGGNAAAIAFDPKVERLST